VRRTTRRNALWGAALVVALAALGLAYLEGEAEVDPEVVAPVPGPRVPAAREVGEGCGEAAVTDHADLNIGREVARCAEGSPEPVPLAQPATVRVALPEPTEGAVPLLVAEAEGEFEDENLTVEIVNLPQAEAYAAMARGEVDAVVGTIDAPFLDAVHGGSPARLVLGGPLARAPGDLEVPQAGLWARTEVLPDPDNWRSVEDQTVAVSGGLGSGALYPIELVLGQGSLTLNSVNVVASPSAVAAQRLVAADVSMAWLPAPAAAAVAGDDAYLLLATLPASEAIEGTVFGPRLLGPDRAVGLAYVRAVVRSINTWLADGWSDEAVAALAEATGQPERAVRAGREPLFDWEVRSGTTTRIQEALISVGGVGYEEPLPDAEVVDRSLYQEAVLGTLG
jgi:NitT/TauT family transport system substrate-binding protein